MSRTLTGAVDAALSASNLPLVAFVEFDFSTGFLRVTNATYNMDWNGYTWLGAGDLGSIGAVQESASLEAHGITFTLSGCNQAIISAALGATYQGRTAKMWLAPLDANHQVLTDPVLVFSGRMDNMNIEVGPNSAVTVNAESRLIDWARPRLRRYTHEDQQLDWPTDKGFEFVPAMVEKPLYWGVFGK